LELWPALLDEPGELKSIQRARHVDVGQHHTDVNPPAQHLESFIRILGLGYAKPGLAQDVDLKDAHEQLVFDNEDHRFVLEVTRVCHVKEGLVLDYRSFARREFLGTAGSDQRALKSAIASYKSAGHILASIQRF